MSEPTGELNEPLIDQPSLDAQRAYRVEHRHQALVAALRALDGRLGALDERMRWTQPDDRGGVLWPFRDQVAEIRQAFAALLTEHGG